MANSTAAETIIGSFKDGGIATPELQRQVTCDDSKVRDLMDFPVLGGL